MYKSGTIYKIENIINGKLYIGQTIHPVDVRLNKHLRDANNKNIKQYNTKLNRAIRKYGKSCWKILPLIENIPEDRLNLEEMLAIYVYDTYDNGYNSTFGGEGLKGYRHSDETKQKLSKSSSGRTHTLEAREKISIAHSGKILSEDTKKKIGIKSLNRTSPRFSNKHHSEETKLKLSLALKGKKINQNIIDKRSLSITGVKVIKTTSSNYVGVSFQKSISRWRAKFQGKYLGIFTTEVEAAVAYNKAAVAKYGSNAKLNIIKEI